MTRKTKMVGKSSRFALGVTLDPCDDGLRVVTIDRTGALGRTGRVVRAPSPPACCEGSPPRRQRHLQSRGTDSFHLMPCSPMRRPTERERRHRCH